MTKEELMALLRDPDQTGQSVDELNRLIEEYSYFHTGHQLYLQGLKKTDGTQLTHQLGKSAMNVRDRGLLYNYINRPAAFRKQTTAPQDEAGEVMTPFAPGNAFVSPEADVQNMTPNQPPATPLPEQAEPTSLQMMNFRGDTSDHVLAEEKIMSNEELMSIIQRQLEQIDPTAPSSPAAAADKTPNATTTGSTTDSSKEENTETVPSVYSTEQLASGLADMTVKQSNAAATILHELKISEENQVPAIETSGKGKNAIHDDLIDSFLKTNPKIVPSDSDYQVDLTQSLQEDQDIATETLADIYASQGHKQKAIDIYEHLILKYPEKHIYFAAQIDRLKH